MEGQGMKILTAKGAPNPRRVRIFLAEKGVEVAMQDLDLMQGALKTPQFAAINSFQRVPVLVLDDGTAIAETVAICRYFEELHPEPPLFGKGPLGVAKVEMWNRRMDLGLLSSVAQAFRHLHPAMAKLEVPQVAAWGEANKPRALDILRIMDAALANHRFLAGEDYSIADITGLVAIDFMKPARIERPPGLDNLARWYQDVSSRASAKA
jgi:glutathione S-transferase